MNQITKTSDVIESGKEIFLRMLNEDHIYLNENLDFHSICTLLGVPSDKLDAAVYKELGMHGQELMDELKSGYLVYIGKKYGLNVGIAR